MCFAYRRISGFLLLSVLLSMLATGDLLLAAESALSQSNEPATQPQNPPPTQNQINNADNAWMLFSAAIVLMMTAPGLTLFYGGLVRSKNVLGTMMHSLVLMAFVSLLWAAFGYSLAFGEGNPFFGNFTQYAFFSGVGAAPNPDYAATIPHETFALFQMMFAIITPALISGAVAERMKFSAYLLFALLWVTIVYLPLAHMMWGKGGYFNWSLGGKVPVLDFAGGTVVHISSGISALVCAMMVGKRTGYPRDPMPPHNVVLSLIGTGLLWVGWFGFNAGSAGSAGSLATSAFAATHFSASGAAVSWMITEWFLKGKPSVLGAASGMVAGLATITPASGFVTVPAALCIGLVGGVACYLAVSKLKMALGYDDALDVFGVHGVGSAIGMVLLGFLASANVNPALVSTFKVQNQIISLSGSGGQVLNQLKGVLFTVIFAGLATFVILKIVKTLTGLRVDEEAESLGSDLTQHGESAYND